MIGYSMLFIGALILTILMIRDLGIKDTAMILISTIVVGVFTTIMVYCLAKGI